MERQVTDPAEYLHPTGFTGGSGHSQPFGAFTCADTFLVSSSAPSCHVTVNVIPTPAEVPAERPVPHEPTPALRCASPRHSPNSRKRSDTRPSGSAFPVVSQRNGARRSLSRVAAHPGQRRGRTVSFGYRLMISDSLRTAIMRGAIFFPSIILVRNGLVTVRVGHRVQSCDAFLNPRKVSDGSC
jgi:hypothetical protein